jgi:hypothetical protein
MCVPEEISDDEIIYRKIPASCGWYDPIRVEVKPEAFKPREGDDGLSVDRAKSEACPLFRSIEEAAVGRSGKEYYVACLRVGVLRERGIQVVPRPIQGNPGHAEIPNLTYENRKSDKSIETMTFLAHGAILRVEGPFLSP